MKTFFKIMIGLVIPALLSAQFNLQQHLDIGRGIQTSTAEFFMLDDLGSTFTFIDINYDSKHFDKAGATDIWFELARYFKLPWSNSNLEFTVQYNDGIYFLPIMGPDLFSTIKPVWLAGVVYPLELGSVRLPLHFLVRNQDGDEELTVQFTTVVYIPVGTRFAVTAFLDLWTHAGGNDYTLLSEPQFLIHHGKWDLGVELEISRNFPAAWTKSQEYFDKTGTPRDKKIWTIPTVFLKYTF